MGGSPKSESNSYSGSGQLWAQPYARQAVGQVQNTVNRAQPGLDKLTNLTQGTLVPQLTQAFQSAAPVAGQATQFNSDVLSGKFLNGNPFIDNILARTNADTINNVNSQFEANGRYGSDAHGYALTRGLADSDNALRYQNYGDEMNRMGTAAQQAQAGQVANAGLLQSMIGTGAAIPYTGSNSLANALGALFSGGTEHNVQTGPDPIWGAIGAGLGAAGSIFAGKSDRRLKTNIELIRRDPDGLGWYKWNWKSDPKGEKAYGVIADEVEKLRPWAHIPDYQGSGYAGVDYGALSDKVAA